MSEIVGNPWFGIAGFAFAILSLLVTIYFGIKTINIARPICYVSAQTILSRTPSVPSDVSVLWKGEPLYNIYKVDFALWNIGNSALKKEDLADTGRISLVPEKDLRIIDARLLWPEASKFINSEFVDNKFLIHLSHLNRGESIVARLLIADLDGHEEKNEKDILQKDFSFLSPIECRYISDLSPDPDSIVPPKSMLYYFYNSCVAASAVGAILMLLYMIAMVLFYFVKISLDKLNIYQIPWDGLPIEFTAVFVVVIGLGAAGHFLLKQAIGKPIFSSKGYEVLSGSTKKA